MMKPVLLHDANNFTAGRLQNFSSNWERFTSDPWVLDTIKGCTIEFEEGPNFSSRKELHFNSNEADIVDKEVVQLCEKGVIIKSEHCQGECISPIFIRPKKDGSHRVILNLKNLNKSIVYRHFKMDTLKSAINLMKPNCYMASLDWKDAYYSVPVAAEFQKYLKFKWRGSLYQFTCLAQGLSPAPRVFTKLTKPIYSHLRKMGHVNSAFIDDSFLMEDTVSDTRRNVMDTMEVVRSAGFVIHPRKSVFEPFQTLVYLGFILNSKDMTVKITPERVSKLRETAIKILNSDRTTIRQVAELVGLMVSSFHGVAHGPLFYRLIDNEKSLALARSRGNFDALMKLSSNSISDIQWWIDNIDNATNSIVRDRPSLTLRADASTVG